MWNELATKPLGLFLIGPREMMVIVLVTAIVVYLAARSRNSKR